MLMLMLRADFAAAAFFRHAFFLSPLLHADADAMPLMLAIAMLDAALPMLRHIRCRRRYSPRCRLLLIADADADFAAYAFAFRRYMLTSCQLLMMILRC